MVFDNIDWFAYSLSGMTDTNADAVPDLAVGAPCDDDGQANSDRGAFYVLYPGLHSLRVCNQYVCLVIKYRRTWAFALKLFFIAVIRVQICNFLTGTSLILLVVFMYNLFLFDKLPSLFLRANGSSQL